MVAFAAQIPMAQSYTLVIPDLPGHGQTPAQGPTSADHDAALIAELLTESTHLVGHSYGGSVALRAAVKRPEAVRSLTLIEPATLDIGQDDPVVRQMLMELFQAIHVADLRDRMIAFATVIGIQKTWPDPLPETYRGLAENLPTMLTPAQGPVVTSRQMAEQIAAAGIPSLVISGGHRESWERLCDLMAKALGSQRDIIAGFKHAPQQSGTVFNDRLERFWAQLP
jgi:pimeloyl-ACP methyl ester carboxylesterase